MSVPPRPKNPSYNPVKKKGKLPMKKKLTPITDVNWKPINTAPHNTPVLVARPSEYIGHDWEYLTARYTAGYHDRWDTLGNDALTDSGANPLWWAPLPNDPPKNEWIKTDIKEVFLDSDTEDEDYDDEDEDLDTDKSSIPFSSLGYIQAAKNNLYPGKVIEAIALNQKECAKLLDEKIKAFEERNK